MDHLWYTVAEYLVLVQAAKCSERQAVGAQLACVSRLHRRAVAEHIKHLPLRVYCASYKHYKLPPLKGFLETYVSFCACKNGFECALTNPCYQRSFFNVRSFFNARCFKSDAEARYTACLAYSQGGDRCLACHAIPLDSDDNTACVVVQKHAKNCLGCIKTEPTICDDCQIARNLLVSNAF
jgi:hypothetical protein